MDKNVQVGKIISADDELSVDEALMSIELELTKPIYIDGVEKSSLILFPPLISDIKYLKKMLYRISSEVRQWLIYYTKYSEQRIASKDRIGYQPRKLNPTHQR